MILNDILLILRLKLPSIKNQEKRMRKDKIINYFFQKIIYFSKSNIKYIIRFDLIR